MIGRYTAENDLLAHLVYLLSLFGIEHSTSYLSIVTVCDRIKTIVELKSVNITDMHFERLTAKFNACQIFLLC